MPTSVEGLPPYPSGWHPWYPFTRMKPTTVEREFYFPPDMLPSTRFGVVNEYDNITIQTPNSESSLTTAASALPSLGFLVFQGSVSFPVALNVILSRKQSWLAAGIETQEIYNPSPRFGFSIGSAFKHQAYIKLVVTGYGTTTTAYQIAWIYAAATPQIEFSTNSRLSKFIVHHGKVGEVDRQAAQEDDTDQTPKLWVKLFENQFEASFTSTPSGKITFYGLRGDGYQSATYDYTAIDGDWYAKMNDPAAADPKAFVPAAGDFFVLNKPIMCDDPQLIHEFDLKLGSDGMFMTAEQRWMVDNRGVGLWLYDSDNEQYVAYTDSDQRSRVDLPNSEAQEAWSEESRTFGGDMKTGVDKWKETTPKLTTVRLITAVHGGQPVQNFFANNLVGEYIVVKGAAPATGGPPTPDEWYEIVGQPRLDTIEINVASVTSGKPFMDNPTATFVSYQQKFWKITELYSGFGVSTSSGALWGGKIASIDPPVDNVTKVTWTAQEYAGFLFLPRSEVSRSGLATLPERFRTKCKLVATAIDGYRKFDGWKAVINGNEYAVKDMTFSPSVGANGTSVAITATVEGNPGIGATAGSLVYVSLGERYKVPFGVQESNVFADISVAPARTTDVTATHAAAQNCLRMKGTYQAGFYELASSLDAKQRIAIASHSYGFNSEETATGVPQDWVTTYAGTTGTCYVEHGAKNRQTVFYHDPELDTLMSVSADLSWGDRRQKAMVRCGDSPKSNASAGVPSWASYLTGMYADVDASDGSKLKGLWAVMPLTGQGSSPYYSQKIQGYAGFKTSLTMTVGADVQMTTVHPVDLPYETYEPVQSDNKHPSIGMPVAAKVESITPSRCGFDEVKTPDRFLAIKTGAQLPVIAPTIPATSFEFTRMRQVVRTPKLFGCHAMGDGTVLLFYGKDSGRFFVASTSNPQNQSKPSVFAIRSDTNIDNWGSPKYNRQQAEAGDAAVAAEWERPLMLAYDFEFAGSVKLATDQFMIFGYGYQRDASGFPTDGRRNTMFLGCYLVSVEGMKAGKTYKCYSTAGGTSVTEEQSMFYYRPNHAGASSPVYEMKFGQEVNGVPTASASTSSSASSAASAATDPADVCPERFTKIIGGLDSGAMISGYALSQEVIAPVVSGDGTLYVYFRDVATDRIMRVWSCSNGGVWHLEQDDAGKIIYYASGSSPAAFGDLLFYFGGDTLYCKNLSTVSEGVYGTKQEQLDKLPVGVVASNVVGHKIAVNTDPSGQIIVFYLNKSGYVCTARSQTAGKTWDYLANW